MPHPDEEAQCPGEVGNKNSPVPRNSRILPRAPLLFFHEQIFPNNRHDWQPLTRKITQMNWLSWALLSALFAGLTAVLAKAGVKSIDSNLATAIRTVVILVFAWTIVLFRGVSGLSQATGRTWLFLVLSGLATGASWLCYFRALQLGEASKVAPIDKLSVVLAMVLAAIFLREHLTWKHCVGAGLIVAGTLVIARI